MSIILGTIFALEGTKPGARSVKLSVREINFQPAVIGKLAKQLSTEAQSITGLQTSDLQSSEFHQAFRAAVERTNARANHVQAYAERVALNSMRCLEHADNIDTVYARRLEELA